MAKEIPFGLPNHKVVVEDNGYCHGIFPHTTEGIRASGQLVIKLAAQGIDTGAPMIGIGYGYTRMGRGGNFEHMTHGVNDGKHPGSNSGVVRTRVSKIELTNNWMD